MPPRTGQEYLQGLQQRQREIWLGGERVQDVTTYPAFANVHAPWRVCTICSTPQVPRHA